MKRLAVERLRLGLSQTELARLTGAVDPSVRPMNHGTISEFELGKRNPTKDGTQLPRLAKALGWQGDPEELLEDVADHATR